MIQMRSAGFEPIELERYTVEHCCLILATKEASLGKTYLEDFGIVGFNTQNPNFDREVIGAFLETYYEGRSEIHIRHEAVEVEHRDFKSQYTTGNSLMGLQELVIAKAVGVK